MALSRTAIVVGTTPIDLVVPWDPAYSASEEAVREYAKTKDQRVLGAPNGVPTIFSVLPLGLEWHRVYSLIRDGSAFDAQLLAFTIGCKRIRGYAYEDGSTGDLPRRLWDDAHLDPSVRAYIGDLIISLSVGPKGAESIPLP